MRRLYVFLVFCLLFSADLAAQVFGNEWIDYGQRYLKVKVSQDGIYRIERVNNT